MIDEDLIKFFASNVKSGFYGDIRLNEMSGNFINTENSAVRRMVKFDDEGFGLRLLKNGVWAFASSNELSKKAIKLAMEKAYKDLNVNVGTKSSLTINPQINNVKLNPSWKEDIRGVDIEKKLKLLLETASAAKGKHSVSTIANYQDYVTHWMVGSNAGNVVSFYESHPKLSVAVFVSDGNSTQSIQKTLGGNSGFEVFGNGANVSLGEAARDEAELIVGAKPVQGGKYDVVLDYSMTGVYTHEAFGHATEADGVVAKNSVLEGKLNKSVGNDMVTIVDDPTIRGAAGSFPFDQEGTAAKKRVLVKDGMLKNYLNTLETSNLLKIEPNGAARAMEHASIPIARMSNTFIAPGDFKEDILDDIKNGIAFYGFQYGYVDPGSGKFMFKSQYGRRIKNGKLGEYVRDASLTGTTLDVLKKIDAIGAKVKLDDGVCGKDGQWVHVASGGPNIRLREVIVGGQ